jgi:hypothetical protein
MKLQIQPLLKVAIIFFIFLLNGCIGHISSENSRYGTRLPSLYNSGILRIEASNNPSYAKHEMHKNCKNFGGLDEKSIKLIHSMQEMRMWFGHSDWEYGCNGFPITTKTLPLREEIPKQGNQGNLDIESSKKKCGDLGFKSGTDGFGKCVLQLSK